jgi:hypothetical protein
MAGSWNHMTTGSGKLRNTETFAGMIENLGDAYEAAEECYGMAWYLAGALAAARMPGAEYVPRARVLEVIREAEEHYEDGLKLGGVQRSR